MFHSLYPAMEISPALGQRQVKVCPTLMEILLHGQKQSLQESVASCHMEQKWAETPVLLKRVEISRWISVKSEFWSWSSGRWSWAVQGTPHSLGDQVPQEPVMCHCSLSLASRCCNEQKWCCGTMVFITPWEEDEGRCDPLQPSAGLTPGDCTGPAAAARSLSPYSSLCQRRFNNLTLSPFPGRTQRSPFKAYF